MKKSKFKNAIFVICLIFSLTPFCLGDEVLEMIKVVQEEVNNLKESDQLKEQRIAALEATKIELVTEVQNLGMKLKQAQKNLTESKVMKFFFSDQ